MTQETTDLGRYWKTIVDTIRDGVLVVDTWGKIMAANPAAEKLTGYRFEELRGKDCRILNCTGCKIMALGPGEKWCGLFSREQVQDKRCLITNKDRRTIHILKSGRVLRDESGQVIGAVETLTDMSQLIRKQQEIQALRRTYRLDDGYYGIIGKSPVIQNLFGLIENVAQSDTPVIIEGQSGTGKELAARAVHEAGARKGKPFVKVNCAALNENLLESELFGHVKGAFTGADKNHVGRFEAAHEGTIFLDEIGDITPSTQVKLLRVLEEKKIERVGDHTPISVDVRIITATNKNLKALVEAGQFREDLYFRINVFPLYLPPLSHRREDIPSIVQHFIHRNAKKTGKRIIGVTPEAMDLLTTYSWPGNIRELRNIIDYAFVLCRDGDIGIEHLPHSIMETSLPFRTETPAYPVPPGKITGKKEELREILRQTGWNQTETARRLGVSRVTVWKRIQKYGIKRPV